MTLFAPALFAAAAVLATANLAEAQTPPQLPPPASVSAEALGYMSTFPPVGDELIDNSNRTRFPQTRWVLQHTRELVPTRNIRRGTAPPFPLPRAERELGAMVFEDDKGQKISVDQWLDATYTDALVVMHKGRIVYERYLNAMKPETPHLLFSITKSFTGLLAAQLAAEGRIDREALVTAYVPELADSAWGDMKVKDVMDMTGAVRYREVYTDPTTEVFPYLYSSNLLPPPAGYAGPRNISEFLKTLQKEGEHGTGFVPIASWGQTPAAATTSGPVQGQVVNDIAVFRGIPFAAPPVGDRRWREPQPVQPWSDVRQAITPGPSCPQKRGLSLEGGGDPGQLDEDCLYLNVFTPRADPGAQLPVMVWIHGGALIFGGGGLSIYDGSALARRGMVVVTINYRLGPLGFFAHPALDKERPGGAVNFGLLDQIAALLWVKANIGNFGGDPAKITIVGQSAGAQSVLALMTSPLASGLFRGAIAQSPYGVPSHTRAKASSTGVAIANAVGLPGAGASMAALRSIPATRLASLEGKGLSLAPGFVVGDEAVPTPLLEAFQKGREAAVPLIIGSNSNDASVALAFGIDPAQLVQKMGKAHVLVRSYYPGVTNDRQLGLMVARDVAFTAFARRIAYLHSAKAPTWRYYFSHAVGDSTGAAHGAEVPFALGTLEQCQCLGRSPNASDRAIERRVVDRWASFATTGSPAGTPVWEPDNRVRGWSLEIGDEDAGRPGFMMARLNAFITALNLLGRHSR